jgi:acyl-CoA synthetase (AMP-forming)/AMP-acid ligase II
MKFPLVVGDFLDRAGHVYPDRVAVVDEPDQPAPGLGSLTYREVARNARAQAAKLDAPGVPVGGRAAFVSQKIARDWNVKASGSGYVTRFEVRRDFLDRYEVRQAGGRTILEYWIPAGDLPELNANITGLIRVTAVYHCNPAAGETVR